MAGQLTRGLIEQVRTTEDDARRRERTARRLYVIGLVAALVISMMAAYVAVRSATRTVEQVAPVVTEALIRDARAQRVANARAVLAGANTELRRRGLPEIAVPGPEATAEELTTAASTAQVLALLPEPVAQQLRDETPDGADLQLPRPEPGGTGGGDSTPVPGGPVPDAGAQAEPSSRRDGRTPGQQPAPQPGPEPGPRTVPSQGGGPMTSAQPRPTPAPPAPAPQPPQLLLPRIILQL